MRMTVYKMCCGTCATCAVGIDHIITFRQLLLWFQMQLVTHSTLLTCYSKQNALKVDSSQVLFLNKWGYSVSRHHSIHTALHFLDKTIPYHSEKNLLTVPDDAEPPDTLLTCSLKLWSSLLALAPFISSKQSFSTIQSWSTLFKFNDCLFSNFLSPMTDN